MVKRRRQIVEGEDEEEGDQDEESPQETEPDNKIKKWLTVKKPTETKKKPAAVKPKADPPAPADAMDLKIGKVKKEKKVVQSSSSLLANMAPATKPPPVVSSGNDPKKAPSSQKMGTKVAVNKQQNTNARFTPPLQGSSTARSPLSAPPPRPPPQQHPPTAASAAPGNSGKGISSLSIPNQEKVLLRRLQGFCETLVKTNTVAKVSGLGPIDVGGSNLPQADELDFFDTNEKGEIVLPAQAIPIFPEDFPPGQREHPLSWWGIVDPEHGRGKYEPMS
jgi:hypothetical protein